VGIVVRYITNRATCPSVVAVLALGGTVIVFANDSTGTPITANNANDCTKMLIDGKYADATTLA
jgi:hypothetical protein